jgi:Concanavalin A-like lectin/glucanases superfamily
MSKRVRQQRKQKPPRRERLVSRKAVISVTLLLSLSVAGVIAARWGAAPSVSPHLTSAPPVPTPTPTPSPSKEYIYAGGRLLATEEPGGGNGGDDGGGGVAGMRSLSLDGTSAYVQANGPNITAAITLEAWVKYNSTGNYQVILSRESFSQAGGGGGYELMITNTGKLRMSLFQTDTTYVSVVGATTISPGTWHHVAGVFDSAQRRVYLDGVLDGSVTGTQAPGSGTAGLKIGRRGSSGIYYFNGLIDEVRVSSSALYTANFTPETSLSASASTAGLWKFDGENLTDYSGSNNPGSPLGGVAYSTDVPTASRYSLSFNGTDGYVQVNSSDSLNITGPITLEAWVKYNSTGNYQVILSRESFSQPGGGGGYELQITNTGKLRMVLFQTDTTYEAVVGATTVSSGAWHHVAGVFDGSQRRVYLDGVQDGAVTDPSGPGSGTRTLKIGRRSSSNIYPFNGLIDEVRISSSALYTGNFTPETNLTKGPNTAGLWRFNDQTVLDSSGNGNTGTINGGVTYTTNVYMAGGYSLALNGTDAYAQVASSASLNITGALTLEAWVKYNSTGTYQIILSRESFSQAGGGGGYELQITNLGKLRLTLFQTQTSYVSVVGATTVAAGVWHHVAGVFDGSQRRVYLDGVLDGSAGGTDAPGTGSMGLKIGRRGSSSIYYFNGRIDEARVSNTAVYTANFTPLNDLSAIAGTAALWRFDAQTVGDTSVNGNTGTLQGEAYYSTDAH